MGQWVSKAGNMATMVGLFSSIGEHMPLFREEKQLEATPESWVNRLHYRITCLLLLVAVTMITCTEWISGTDSIIDCMHGPGLPEAVVKWYCYIQGTFVIPRNYDKEVGIQVSQTGVGPYNPETDDISVKAYYQWVPFMLFLQAIMFYLPHVVYEMTEGNKVKRILGSLNLWVLNKEKRRGAEDDLAKYFVETMGIHDMWSVQILLAHCLYLVNVIGQIYFTDAFLGYEFSKYGVSIVSMLDKDPSDRVDPMSQVFPRVTKCTFHKYGPSGSIQRHDIQCVMPINIINEKIYVALWFWLMLLSFLTIFDLLHHIILVTFRGVRWMILNRKLKTAPRFKLEMMDIDLALISRSMSFGDWKLCYHIIRNMDSLTAAEWLQCVTEKLREEKEKKVHDTETLPLKSKLATE